jgi:hypothetical protein
VRPEPKPESWFRSPEFDAECRRRRVRQRGYFKRKAREEVADPDEFTPRLKAARDGYFSKPGAKPRRGDPRQALPGGGDLQALADTFGAEPERLAQAEEMRKFGLHSKGKRLLLCNRLGRRVDCADSPEHRFFQPYRCLCRYCTTCGPSWFRQQFTDLLATLGPVVEHLLEQGRRHRREMVIAKLDFTVPNTGSMPSGKYVRQFHKDLHRFRRAMERRFGISPDEYGLLGCDEFGGGNTNLHRHCVYVGPRLPQSKAGKELSALWTEIRGERSFVSIKRARSFRAALAHALKYPAKFLSASTPERLATLEVTFHKTRRFSTGGAFYNVKSVREPGEDSPIGECPICGARLLEVVESWVPRSVLDAEGRRDVEEVRREVGRARILTGAGPP